MDLQQILDSLPPYRFQRDIIVPDDQRTDDIIIQVLRAHELCKSDYDLLTGFFQGGNVGKKLFDFCKKYLPYNEEPGEDQTTRSPAGILELSQTIGVDCKHYAGWIAGILDALNRKGYDFDWCYRFVSYTNRKKADHVYVVLGDIWLDPTPLFIKKGVYRERNFNDRFLLPVYYLDLKPADMLSHMSGVHYTVSNDSENGGCMGKGDSQAGVLDAVTSTASQLAGLLPAGGLRDFVQSFVTNPTGAIINLINGKKYTSGNYALGEMYMRNILGMSQIQSRQQVPDEYVPQAWQFFTLALGIEIGANDHLDRLFESPQTYIMYMSPQVGSQNINPAAVERGYQILHMLNYGPAVRDITWPLKTFGAIPYVYPIPDVEPGTFYSGVHPITGERLINGYPETKNTTDTVSPPLSTVMTTTQEPGQTPTPPPPKPSGTGMGTTGWVILGGLGLLGVALAMNSKKRRR